MSVARILRRIKAEKRAIRGHVNQLVKLRGELEYAESYLEGAHRHLQDAINDLCRVE